MRLGLWTRSVPPLLTDVDGDSGVLMEGEKEGGLSRHEKAGTRWGGEGNDQRDRGKWWSNFIRMGGLDYVERLRRDVVVGVWGRNC